MGTDATVSIALILGIISALGVMVSIYLGIKKAHTEEDERIVENAREFTKLNVKLDNFTSTMNELVKKSERSVTELNALDVSVMKCSERIETLFKYKDDHEKRLQKLEDGGE
jgi:hypothetical protein